ncbi:MAG: PD40 domain-containing protein, partial [Gemmatimonadetes bacterium]|nr:PD40 domain-containing protein [Gemmatimonadota bacterium]
NYDIYVMDADGGSQTRLTDNSDLDISPAWSPDGTEIAFASLRDHIVNIYVMDADGGNQTRLTGNRTLVDNPAWSPDGTRIAFEFRHDTWEIYSIRIK